MITIEIGSYIDEHGKIYSTCRPYCDITKKALIPNVSVIGNVFIDDGKMRKVEVGVYKFGQYTTPVGHFAYGPFVESSDGKQLPLSGSLLDCIVF